MVQGKLSAPLLFIALSSLIPCKYSVPTRLAGYVIHHNERNITIDTSVLAHDIAISYFLMRGCCCGYWGVFTRDRG